MSRLKNLENMSIGELREYARALRRRNEWLSGQLLDALCSGEKLVDPPPDFEPWLGVTDVVDPAAAPMEVARKAYVYFIAAGGLVKIGLTRDLETRVRSIQAMSGYQCRLLGAIAVEATDVLGVEQSLHRRFGSARRHGEWFDITPAAAAAVIEEFGGHVEADGP